MSWPKTQATKRWPLALSSWLVDCDNGHRLILSWMAFSLMLLLIPYGSRPNHNHLGHEKQSAPLESGGPTAYFSSQHSLWTKLHWCPLPTSCFALASVVWEIVVILSKSNKTPDCEGLDPTARWGPLQNAFGNANEGLLWNVPGSMHQVSQECH